MPHLVLSADWIEAWRRWAALGTGVACAWQRMTDWQAVVRMVEAAKKTLKGEAKRLRSLLKQSDRQLAPWGEPLLVDLGMHRWLANDREGAYSDWLAWIVEQLKAPELVSACLARSVLPNGLLVQRSRRLAGSRLSLTDVLDMEGDWTFSLTMRACPCLSSR